jgi:hypothetical protein
MKNTSKKIQIFGFCLFLGSIFSSCMISKDITYSKIEINQQSAISKVLNFINNQVTTYSNEKRFATSEELNVENRQVSGYSIEMKSDDKHFQIWATPKEYKKTGEFSYYADSDDGDVRGADLQGRKANANDPIIEQNSDELKAVLKNRN